MSDNNQDNDRMMLKKVCIFNNSLKCHVQSAYIIPAGKTTDASGADSKFFDFVEKVCTKCPTYLFIKDRGIPK